MGASFAVIRYKTIPDPIYSSMNEIPRSTLILIAVAGNKEMEIWLCFGNQGKVFLLAFHEKAFVEGK